MKRICIIFLAILAIGCQTQEKLEKLKITQEQVEEAYVWGLPIVSMYRYYKIMRPNGSGLNQLYHNRNLTEQLERNMKNKILIPLYLLSTIDAAIESSMKLLVEFFDVDRCHLGKISDDQSKIIVSYFKRYYEIVSKAAFSQAFLRLPGCVVHSAQANRPKEVSHV